MNRCVARVRRALLCLALIASPAAATPPAGHGSGSSTSGNGQSHAHHGRLVTVLPDGTLREPSIERLESTIGTDVLDAGDWSWEIGASASGADIGGSPTGSVSVLEPSLDHGAGHGFQLGLAGEGWTGSRVEQGSPPAPVTETGLGGMRVTCAQRLYGDGQHTATALAGSVHLPGGTDSPGPHALEATLALPLSTPIGPRAHFGAMLEGEWMGDALDEGHHLNGVASTEFAGALRGEWSGWLEAVSVWSNESGRPWLGVLDGGVEGDVAPHVGVRLGLSAGIGGGRGDVGVLGGMSVHG